VVNVVRAVFDEPVDLRLTCRLPAPRERVFTALVDPELLARWWRPAGFTLPEIELDARPTGRYRFTMQPPTGEAFHLAGEFLVVEPPERLSFTFRWEEPDPDDQETVATLTLTGRGDETEVALVQGPFRTEARRELHHGGWTDSLDRLAAALSS